MKTQLLCLSSLLAVLSVHAADSAAATGAVDAKAFKLIVDRNIFNPNRRPGRSENSAPRPQREVRTDSITLHGTLLHEHGAVAFFDGTQTGRKALKKGDSIAGFRIAEIDWSYVKLSSNDQQTELAVGQQLVKREGEDWKVSGEPSSPRPADSGLSDSAASGSSSDDDELIRKLMEKRAQEVNK